MTDLNAKKIALVQSYMALKKTIVSDIKKALSTHQVKKSYFAEKLDLEPVTFYRRMHGINDWKPEEIISVIKIIEKLEQTKNDR